jgi:hypothetical protein
MNRLFDELERGFRDALIEHEKTAAPKNQAGGPVSSASPPPTASSPSMATPAAPPPSTSGQAGTGYVSNAASQVYNGIVHPIDSAKQGFQSNVNAVKSVASNVVGKAESSMMGDMMGGLAKYAPLLMLGMGAMGGMGGGGQAAPGQPIANQTDPFRMNRGFKYGSEKRSFLAPMILSAGKDAVNQLTSSSKPEEKKEKTELSSKDPEVEKALENPSVKSYINRLVSDTN